MKHYQCSKDPFPPGQELSTGAGFCCRSLGASPAAHADPRCPETCKHKAPITVAAQYFQILRAQGRAAAGLYAASAAGAPIRKK